VAEREQVLGSERSAGGVVDDDAALDTFDPAIDNHYRS
jgi:hypothetical protein